MDDIFIIDNAVPEEQQDIIERLVTGDSFGWMYNPQTAYTNQLLEKISFQDEFFKDSLDSPLFSHILWNEYGRNSHMFNAFIPVLDATPYQFHRLVRCKINLTLPVEGSTKDTHSYPHVDYVDNEGLITGLYYVNDSDGDTFLFNEMSPHKGALTIAKRISSKKGRLVLFDSQRYHAGNNPIHHPTRLTLNFNFYPDVKKQ